MLNLKKIAVTGNLATGKSSVCRFLKQFGAYYVDADAVVHRIYSQDKACKEQIIKQFGPDVVSNGSISRKKLSDIVFSSLYELQKLEAIIHPLVIQEIQKEYAKVEQLLKMPPEVQNLNFELQRVYSLFVVEIPLLFEICFQDWFDIVILVTCQEEVSRQRFVARGGNIEQFNSRYQRMISQEQKQPQADLVIENYGTLDQLFHQTKTIYQQLLPKK